MATNIVLDTLLPWKQTGVHSQVDLEHTHICTVRALYAADVGRPTGLKDPLSGVCIPLGGPLIDCERFCSVHL